MFLDFYYEIFWSDIMDTKRKLINKKDIIIISLIFLIAVLYYLFYLRFHAVNENVKAQILINGNLKYTIELDKNKTFSISEKPNIVFEIQDDKIRFLSSDCPDKICVKSGFLGTSGQMAACLPNAISIRIISEKAHNDIDTVI